MFINSTSTTTQESVSRKDFLGDQRGSNPRIQSHNLVPKPLGHGHRAPREGQSVSRMERLRFRDRAHVGPRTQKVARPDGERKKRFTKDVSLPL